MRNPEFETERKESDMPTIGRPYGSWIAPPKSYLFRKLELTGAVRHVHRTRRSIRWFGPDVLEDYMALEVEESFERASRDASGAPLGPWEEGKHWRDALPLDLASPALRWLIDGE